MIIQGYFFKSELFWGNLRDTFKKLFKEKNIHGFLIMLLKGYQGYFMMNSRSYNRRFFESIC